MTDISYTMDDLMRFAPVVILHRDDPYRPSSVEWYLNQVVLYACKNVKEDDDWKPDLSTSRVVESNVTSELLGTLDYDSFIEQTLYLKVKGGGASTLVSPVYSGEQLENDQVQAPMYVYVRPGKNYVDLYYWTFYPFNGPQEVRAGVGSTPFSTDKYSATWPMFATHEGDWEHINVRVTKTLDEVLAVYYSRHGAKESAWVTGSHVSFWEGTQHPIVCSAKHSHGCYERYDIAVTLEEMPDHYIAPAMPFGLHWLKLVDRVDNKGGPTWMPWANRGGLIELRLDQNNVPLHGQHWMCFNGRWGDIWPKNTLRIGPFVPDLPGIGDTIFAGETVFAQLFDWLPDSTTERQGPYFQAQVKEDPAMDFAIVKDNKLLMALWSGWSSHREDTRTQIGKKLGEGYAYLDHMGYVLDKEQPDTIPLYGGWNGSRSDTRVEVQRASLDNDGYEYVDRMGYIYEVEQPDTLALYCGWRGNRSDTRTVTNRASLVNDGYSDVYPLGYILKVPEPEGLAGLYSAWNGSRNDTRTQVGSAFEGGYEWVDRLGYVYTEAQPGTVPLYSGWNSSRNDTRTDTNRASLANDNYGWINTIGYVHKEEQPGTIPLYCGWNGSRNDTRTAAILKTLEEEGYGYICAVGYILKEPPVA